MSLASRALIQKAIEGWSDDHGGHPGARDSDVANLAERIDQALADAVAGALAQVHIAALRNHVQEGLALSLTEGSGVTLRPRMAAQVLGLLDAVAQLQLQNQRLQETIQLLGEPNAVVVDPEHYRELLAAQARIRRKDPS